MIKKTIFYKKIRKYLSEKESRKYTKKAYSIIGEIAGLPILYERALNRINQKTSSEKEFKKSIESILKEN